jgi:competence protein ComEC
MRVVIFDVEHGSSHIIRTPSDQYIMIDAGSTEDFSPALHLLNLWETKNVRWFTLTHHDADHLTDINNVAEYLQVTTIECPALDESQLSQLYPDEFSTPLEVFLEYKKNFIRPVPPMGDLSYDWGGVQFATFSNNFTDFEKPNINDLSIVTFAIYMGWTFIFPGDLEVAGWKKLMENPEFCEWLKRVDVFVASHHGRESGFCKEVFDYSSPKIVIMSDKSQSETSCPDKYRPFAQGLSVVNGASETKKRYVLTTANDGAIYIHIDTFGNYIIATTL